MEERKKVREMTPVSPGDVVEGVIEQIMPYGAFVRLKTGQRAMVHVSQLSHNFVKNVSDILAPQQEIKAKIIKIDDKGRIDLSIKAMSEPPVRARAPFRKNFNNSNSRDGSSHAGSGGGEEDFEKKLTNFLKKSEEKIASISSGNKSNGRGSRKRGG